MICVDQLSSSEIRVSYMQPWLNWRRKVVWFGGGDDNILTHTSLAFISLHGYLLYKFAVKPKNLVGDCPYM